MSKVYFTKTFSKDTVTKLAEKSGINSLVSKNDFVAIKIHFGEKGNLGYIKPEYVKPIVEVVKSLGGKPFLTDANTIYKGSRANAVDHLNIAIEHGFGICGCPIIIADGLRGNSYIDVNVNLKHFKSVKVAWDIYYADKFIFLTHFKGHEISGFGGAIKNIGMGCGARAGKYEMHNAIKPEVNPEKCTGCGSCVRWCPSNALKLSNKKIIINKDICVGCGECILSCEQYAIKIPWDESTKNVQEKIVEYAAGVLKNKKAIYINFLNYITKFCDCYATKENPLLEDIGILTSDDAVAIDAASADLVNKKFDGDFFRHIFPDIDWSIQTKYAEKIGLGRRQYTLTEI
ncbi:MAG: DUF362 domain-containing protein [Elusimicrobia bacterium]|nr:DUF362 domain-containing protein [Elusimicrobiota bacterium]